MSDNQIRWVCHPGCGHANLPSELVCGQCGKSLEAVCKEGDAEDIGPLPPVKVLIEAGSQLQDWVENSRRRGLSEYTVAGMLVGGAMGRLIQQGVPADKVVADMHAMVDENLAEMQHAAATGTGPFAEIMVELVKNEVTKKLGVLAPRAPQPQITPEEIDALSKETP